MKIKKCLIALFVLSMIVAICPIKNVHAQQDNTVDMIYDGIKYSGSVIETDDKNIASITDENGKQYTVEYNKVSNQIIYNGNTYDVSYEVEELENSLSKAYAIISGSKAKSVINKYRSGSKITSGKYKGKYKYWTNAKSTANGRTIINENHSFYYK